MAFSDFQNVAQMLHRYPLRIQQAHFLPEACAALPGWLRDNVQFLLTMKSVEENEAFFAEGFIFPLLQHAWMQHPTLKLWSHRALVYGEVLFGEPDYLIAAIAEGVTESLLQRPMVVVLEAKKEDFSRAWGQCLAAMLACQKINADDAVPIYGIVSTGMVWEFAQLCGQTFTKHIFTYAIRDLPRVCGLIDHIFAVCEDAVQSYSER